MTQRLLVYCFLAALLSASAIAAGSSEPDSVSVVQGFLREVWQNGNPEAVDKYVVEDFVITTGGKEIRSREPFKKWVAEFQAKISDLKLDILETIPNADGSRVVTRLRVTGKNNGMFGLKADQKPFVLTATAVFAVTPEGKLKHNWVERNAWEVYTHLTSN